MPEAAHLSLTESTIDDELAGLHSDAPYMYFTSLIFLLHCSMLHILLLISFIMYSFLTVVIFPKIFFKNDLIS